MSNLRYLGFLLISLGCESSKQNTIEDELHNTDTAISDTSSNIDSADETGEIDSGDIDPNSLDARDCPEDSFLTWETFGRGFMLDYCLGCHSSLLEEEHRAGAPPGVDFNTREDILAWKERIYARSADSNTTMPLVDTVSAQERIWLGDWLACGAPE